MNIKRKISGSLAVVFMVALLMAGFASRASATTLNQAGVRLGRLNFSATTGNDLLVTFKLNTTPTSVSKIDVTFPTGFTITAGTPATGTTFPNTPASITAPPGLPATATATAGTKDIMVSGLTSASLTNTTLYGFTIPTGTVANPASSGQYNVTVCSGGSSLTAGCASNVIDQTVVPVSIVGSSGNNDQISVTATVNPNFSFALTGTGCPSACADTIPAVNATDASQTSTGITMTVSTNSTLGYTAYIKSAQGYLHSTLHSGTNITTGTFDGTADTHAAGTTLYTFVPQDGTENCSGSKVYDGEYSNGSSAQISLATKGGSFNSTNYASFFSCAGFTNSDQLVLKERVSVAAGVLAATDYTDTLTVVAAGNF